jgi:hypothetical protein
MYRKPYAIKIASTVWEEILIKKSKNELIYFIRLVPGSIPGQPISKRVFLFNN